MLVIKEDTVIRVGGVTLKAGQEIPKRLLEAKTEKGGLKYPNLKDNGEERKEKATGSQATGS